MSGSVPPPARSRSRCDFPEPFAPRIATRSPNQTSTSNGFGAGFGFAFQATFEHGALSVGDTPSDLTLMTTTGGAVWNMVVNTTKL